MKKLFRNVSYTFAGKLAAMLFLTLLDVLAARLLGVDLYAEWVYFFAALTMLFYLGWFGINTSAKVFVSKCKDDVEKAGCIAAAVLLRFVVSVAVALLIELIVPRIAPLLGYPNKYPDLKWLLVTSGVLVFLNSFSELFKELMIGTNNFKKLFFITVIEYSGYFLFSTVGLIFFKTVKSIAIGYIISGVIVGVVGFSIFYRQSRASLKKIDKSLKAFGKRAFPMLKYAMPIAVISFGGMILVEMDTFMLGIMSSKEEVAVYSIAKNLCSKATHINYALITGVMTSFSVINDENWRQKEKDFRKASILNCGIVLVVVLGFVVLSDVVIFLLYGSSYGKSAALIRILSIYYALYSVSTFFSGFLDFRGKAVSRSLFYSTVPIVNLILNYLWIPQYGSIGAAIATSFSLIPYTVAVIIMGFGEWKHIRQKASQRPFAPN